MTMELSDIQKVANLARLKLSLDEAKNLCSDIGRIVEYVETLNELDLTNIAPLCYVNESPIELLSDTVGEHPVGRLGISGSAGYEDGLVRVPKIIE